MMETHVLIQEIHKKHQITLKPDDPVFVAATLNDLLLSHYLEKFQALLEEQNKLVVSQGIERLNQASAMGSEMINRSLEALGQTLQEELSQIEGIATRANAIRSQQQAQDFNKIMSKLRWEIYSIIACSIFALGIILKLIFL